MSDPFVEKLLKPLPSPGGGSTCAYAATVGMALLTKVSSIEKNRRRKDPTISAFWDEIIIKNNQLAARLGKLMQDDDEAYANYCLVRRGSSSEDKLLLAVRKIIDAPMFIMETALEGLKLAGTVSRECAPHLCTDVAVVRQLLAAAVRGCKEIGSANLEFLNDEMIREELSGKIIALSSRCRD
jgi:formiminotetrahydrofolate cyclodeaminase